MSANAPETSVMFSLAELANIEEERVREEAAQRRERDAIERAAALAQQDRERRAEEKRIAAEERRRSELHRKRVEIEAHATAREQAEVEVVRIEAEARVRLEAENAARAHELQVLQVKSDGGRVRMRNALIALVALVLVGGSGLGWAYHDGTSRLGAEAQQLREDRWASSQAREEALTAHLRSLDARFAALDSRFERLGTAAVTASKERSRAEASRSAIEASGVDAPKLSALATAVDALAAAITRAEHIASLDERLRDLKPWAEREAVASTAAENAADEAKRGGSVDRYRHALASLATDLADRDSPPRRGGRRSPRTPPASTPTTPTGNICTNPNDPLCGPDGKMLPQ